LINWNEIKRHKWKITTLATLGALACFAAAWWIGNISTTQPSDEADVRVAQVQGVLLIFQVFGGVLALVALASALLSAIRSAESAQQQLLLDRKGQSADRFLKAVELLNANREGDPQIELRLGGIYALEQISTDAPGDYHATIIELLSAFVRNNSSRVHCSEHRGRSQFDFINYGRFPEDVAAALTVKGRTRATPARRSMERGRLNRSITNLCNAQLAGLHLENADFELTGLDDANLRGAHLVNSYFLEAHMSGADLSGADISGVGFAFTDLSLVRGLSHEQLEKANVEEDGVFFPAVS
jgi:hypothetical protein